MQITSKDINLEIDKEKNKILKLKESDQLVAGLFNPLFPSSILKGCGYRPFRMAVGATTDAEGAGEKFVRPDSCPFCKTLIGNLSYDNTLHSSADIIIAVNSCDQIRRSAEVVANALDKNILQIQFLVTYTNSSKEYFLSELKFIINALEKKSGQKFNIEKALHYHNEQQRASAKMRDLYFSKLVPPTILHSLSILYSLAEPTEFNNYIDKIKPNLPEFRSSKTVILIGSPTLLEDDGLIRLLEHYKISTIILNSTGLKQFMSPVDKSNIKSISADKDLGNFLLESFPHIGMRPNGKLYKQITETIEKVNADAVIMKSLSFCDLWYTEKVRLKQTLPVPVLTIDTGYGEGSADRIETRVETFLETL